MAAPALRGAVRRAGESASQHAVATGYVGAWRLVRLLPERRARALFDRVADRVHRGDGRGVQRLRANLATVAPGLDDAALEDLTHRAVRSYLRYWCESFRLPAWPTDDLVARTRTVGEHHLREPFAEGRGAVVALPHMGNWDWAGAWACATGMPVVSVAERLRPERLFDEFLAYRRTLGMEILPLTGDQPPLPRLVELLGDGRLVCLLADRDLSRSSVPVTLCGQPARMPAGPARLARETGTALVPVTTRYDGDDLEITFHPAVPHRPGEEGIPAMMQDVADAFGRGIAAHPVDWHMMQRVFTADVDGPGEEAS